MRFKDAPLFLCLVLLGLAADSLAAQGPPPTLVAVEPLREAMMHDQLTLVGRTQARAESRIVAEISGRVRSVDAAEGRRLERGAALVTIDCRSTALVLEAKGAEAAQAKAQAVLAEKELARAEDLVRTEVFPQRNLDSAVAEASRSAARFRELDAERRRLELDLENCTIRAPYGGTTVRKLVDVGEWVDAGTPVYELVDLSIAKVTVDLPERRFGELELGSKATITTAGDDAALEGRAEIEGTAALEGTVVGIAPRASESTHTFPVLIEVENRNGRLGSGMLVRATLNLRGTFQSLAAPKDAIVRQGDSTVLYSVADGLAVRIPVRVLASEGSLVAVEAAGDVPIAAGLDVVTRGNERIFPGGPVRVEGADADANR